MDASTYLLTSFISMKDFRHAIGFLAFLVVMQSRLLAQVDSTYIHGVDYKAYFDSIYSPLNLTTISSGIFTSVNRTKNES
jgi:hypothetical protein